MAIESDKLMSSLVGKLYSILTSGDDPATPPPPGNFIAWCTPGIPLPADDLEFLGTGALAGSAADIRRRLGQAADFSRLVNFVPDASGIYDGGQQDNSLRQNGGTLGAAYENVLKS